jgi:L-ascorbate metabolism protein UlaG (beta-lactamase superfamily)
LHGLHGEITGEYTIGRGMRITWYAHACFRLEGSGVSIVTDPYTPGESGPPPITEPADAVVMSSALDRAHAGWQMVPGSPHVVNALDAVAAPIRVAGSVDVAGVAASEGSDRPDDPKANALYTLTLDGVRVCHMGDVGTPLDDEQLEPLRGRVDLLLALAGAKLTIALPDLDRAIEEIGPRVVVPMHYQTPRIRYDLGPLDDFLDRHESDPVFHAGESSIELTTDTLPAERTIVVLEPLLG